MQSFKDWLLSQESSPTTRALNAPWAYPALYVGGNPFSNYYNPKMLGNYKKMIKRDKKKSKKKVRKPDKSIDGFVDELDFLKKDLNSLADKHKKDREQNKDQVIKKPVKAEVDDDLKKAAKEVVSNLSSSPGFYARRVHIDRLAGIERGAAPKKVSRDDARKVAKELGVDFAKVKFTPEAFRKGVEAELRRTNKPSQVDQKTKDQLDDDDLRPSLDNDRSDIGD